MKSRPFRPEKRNRRPPLAPRTPVGGRPAMQPLHRFRTLLDHANDIILLVHLESRRIVDANVSACRHLRCPSGSLIGMPIEKIVDFEHLQWPEKMGDGPECRTIATALQRLDGVDVPVEMLFCLDDYDGTAYVVIVARDISERLRVEEALRQSEERFRSIVDSTPLGVHLYRLEAGGRLVFAGANPAADVILGVDNGQFVGLPLEEAFPSLAATEIPERYRRTCLLGEPWTSEQVFYEDRRVRGAFQVHAFKTGPGMMASIFMDITERKKGEEALSQSRKRFRDLVETINDWVWEVDNNGVYTYASPRVQDLLGYEPEEVVGRTPFDLMLESELERVSRLFADKMQKHEAFSSIENINRHKDGHLIILETSGVPFFDDEGSLLGYRGIDRDITDRKRAEEALHESEERFRATFNQVAVGIGLVGPDGRWLRINQKYCDIVGYTEEEMHALTIGDITHPDDRKESLENFRLLLEGKLAEYSLEKRYIHKDGSTVWINLNASIVTDAAGNPRFAIGVVEDITNRRRAEEALRESDRMKSEFISTAAHELRTPLTSILGFSQVLLDQEHLPPSEQREFLSYIHQQATALSGIVTDLLDISRIESGQGLALARVDCTAGELVSQLTPLIQGAADGRRFEIALAAETTPLYLDMGKMARVFENLLSNALKYSPPRTPIRIAGAPAGAGYQFSVTDRGIGMSSQQVDRVFDKFYRADASNTATGGLGLGMSIVRNIVEAHGGRIWVESAPGVGTTVRFNVPLRQGEGSPDA